MPRLCRSNQMAYLVNATTDLAHDIVELGLQRLEVTGI